MKKIILFFVLMFMLSFASAGGEVGKSNLGGVWETVGFVPYARLEFNADAEGLLIAVYSKDHTSIFELRNYSPVEGGFTIDVAELNSTDEPEKFEGSFFGGQLHLKSFSKEDDEGTWFTRIEKAAEFKKIAESERKKYGRKKD